MVDGKQAHKMRRYIWRSIVAIYLIIGVLSLMACVSIAISNNGADVESEIDGPDTNKETDIKIGE